MLSPCIVDFTKIPFVSMFFFFISTHAIFVTQRAVFMYLLQLVVSIYKYYLDHEQESRGEHNNVIVINILLEIFVQLLKIKFKMALFYKKNCKRH